MSFKCRFAPSPTGPLHIGGVRTALFNWLLAKKNKGKFFLRIEDTDKERSEERYKEQIIKSLEWLGLTYDDEVFIQSKNINKHQEIAKTLLKTGFAYYCNCSTEELEQHKKDCIKKGLPYTYSRKCRELNINKNEKSVLRFKSNITGNSTIEDLVQGKIIIENSTVEDFVILRNDETPTYQLSAAVDDHEMQITHIIRGDDHKINSFKQKQIHEAMKWQTPSFAHVPLIHSFEGKKMSKRDKAATIDEYIEMGIIPDALRNYLLRLGWSYKDKEIFSLEESINLFNFDGIGKSPSKFDLTRVLSINETYIKNTSEDVLFKYLNDYIKLFKKDYKLDKLKSIEVSLYFLKNKAKTLNDIYNNALYLLKETLDYKKEDIELISKGKKIINNFIDQFSKSKDINKDTIKVIIEKIITENKIDFKTVGQPLRIALTGSKFGPGIYDILLSLEKSEVIKRLDKFK